MLGVGEFNAAGIAVGVGDITAVFVGDLENFTPRVVGIFCHGRVYQEQVMARVRQMTGCSLGRADILRKASALAGGLLSPVTPGEC